MAKQEWVSKTIKRIPITDNVEWRLQRSTSPQGKEFFGIRRFSRRGEDLRPDNQGINIAVDDTDTVVAINRLLKLLHSKQKAAE